MAARILGNTTAASVASVKLRAGVASVVPIVGLTRVYPVSEVAYILMVVGAYLDTTGRYKYTTDIFGVSDIASLNTSKVADADAFTLADDTTLSADKGLSDTASLSDTAITVLIFIRDFADTASPADANTLLISPAYSDAVTSSDTTALSLDKTLTDSFALNDLSDATGPTISFADFTNNVVSASDSSVVTSDKGFSDSLSLSDSGTVISQNYCDITYFLTDYVGESRTF
jgi:hypothetical protein